MQAQSPVTATLTNVPHLIGLGKSSQLFLTAYLKTSRHEVINNELRAHVSNLLGAIAEEVETTPWRDAFREQRRRVEDFAESVRPGTDALVLCNSVDGEEFHALWLPEPVNDEVRFGPGAYVLPLMDLLDEWEPLVLAFVEKDQARLITAGAGQVDEIKEYHANVPGRHNEGGWSQRRYERHTVVHIERHLEAVAKDLGAIVQPGGIRRVFLAGPVEPVKRFRNDLPPAVAGLVQEELPIDAHASPDDMIKRVLPAARQAERQEEEAVVEELVTRAEKNAQAVTGVNETMAAMNRHEVYKLAMSADINSDARYCMGSQLLFGPMGAHEEQCVGPVRNVWLRQELPCYALQRNVEIEIVHGDAARLLNQHGGVGGFIQSPRR
ncbi:MAG: Vms1/Ankzf1 family peptidyl-tRNA hydrolase [Dehalococcoidia bacterium]